MLPDLDTRVKITQLLAEENSLLCYINTQNEKVGHTRDVSKAVASGLPFFVKAKEHFLVLDIDSTDTTDVDYFSEILLAAKYNPVIFKSSDRGHFHLFCRIDSLEDRTWLRHTARSRRIRSQQTIRPPYVPHRLSGISSPHNSNTAFSVIEAFETPTGDQSRLAQMVQAKEVNEEGEVNYDLEYRGANGKTELLRREMGEYATRSEWHMAYLTHCVYRGFPFDQIIRDLRKYPVGAKFRSWGRYGEKQVKKEIGKVLKLVRGSLDDRNWNQIFSEMQGRLQSRGRVRAAESLILAAHLSRAKWGQYFLSHRQIQSLTGISSRKFISRYNKNLQELGLIKNLGCFYPWATEYDTKIGRYIKLSNLKRGEETCITTNTCNSNTQDSKIKAFSENISYSNTKGLNLVVNLLNPTFRQAWNGERGLGRSTFLVLVELMHGECLNIKQLIERTTLSKPTVLRCLQKLRFLKVVQSEFVQVEGSKRKCKEWCLLMPPSEVRLALDRFGCYQGFDIAQACLILRHKAERECYLLMRKRKRKRGEHGTKGERRRYCLPLWVETV